MHNAEQVRQWQHLLNLVSRWRELRHLQFIFLSTEPALTRNEDGQLAPHLAALRDSSQGQLVVCSHPSPEDLAAWVRDYLPDCTPNTAYFMVTRCGESLRAIRDTITMLKIIGQPPTRQLVDDLTCQVPQAEYVDALVAGDKKAAMLAASHLIPDEMGAVIGLLDSRLDTLRKLHDSLDMRPDEVRTRLGVPQFLITKYRRHARDYRPETCERRRKLLAMADEAARHGARDGTPEFIAALW